LIDNNHVSIIRFYDTDESPIFRILQIPWIKTPIPRPLYSSLSKRLNNLDVPYFKQTVIGSCGPAALLMVLKYHRPETDMNRVLEFRAWRYASLFPFGMTDAPGLAGFAAKRGLKALVLKEEPGFELYFDYGSLRRLFTAAMLPILRFNYHRIRRDALRRGVEERYGKISINSVEEFVRVGKPPIVMVDQTGYAPDDNWQDGVLHWIVVTGFDAKNIRINDPDMGPLTVSKTSFEKALDLRRNFETDRRIVVVSPNDFSSSSYAEPR
jgi:hypothetical protein